MKRLLRSIIWMCVVMMVMGLCADSSYSQEKPLEDSIKKIIGPIVFNNYMRANPHGLPYWKLGSYQFEQFIITNAFDKTISGETNYCIEVNYVIKLNVISSHDGAPLYDFTRTAEGAQFHFKKQGTKWYGGDGW